MSRREAATRPSASRPRRPFSWRRALLPIHRWIALTLGIVVLASAITGAGMAFRKQLDPLVYPRMLQAPACAARLPLDQFVSRARALHPTGKLDYIRLLGRPDAPVILRFADKDTYYFDPCSGAVLGEQNRYAGFFGRIEQLHRFVYVKNGGWLVGAGALAAALGLVIGGLVVWWPRAPRRLADGFRLNTNLRGRAFELDLHRTLGAYAATLLLVSSLTALPQAFDFVKNGLNTLTGTPTETTPQSAPPATTGHKAAKISMEQAWRMVQALSPHPREALLHLPLKARSPIEIFTIAADAPHANARTYLYLDAYSGRVLRFTPYRRMGLGGKIYFWTLSIHTGEVGGIVGQVLLFLGALSVPVLAYTGVSSYLRRRFARRTPAPPIAADGAPPGQPTGRRVRVARITTEAPGVKSFELVSADGRPLTPATPGAHIDVHPLPGLVRQYSLCSGPQDQDRYLIAVRRDSASRGGSRAMHDKVRQGDLLSISEPRNHFALHDAAASHLLLARGIGITPILAMGRALAAAGADFRLEYFTRSAEHTPFHDLLSGPEFAGRVRFHHGLEVEAQAELIEGLLSARPDGAHVYVCGARPFMDMVEAAARAWPAEALHREYFTADPCAWAGERHGFEVKLAHSGTTIHVPPELSIASALAGAGIHVETSCEQGVCGACLTRVLDGAPDHRDAVLSAVERERGDRMLVCVSRAYGGQLTLDL
ncbi:MAG: hypothetical protein JWP73_965 [Phenylobacterium sp.]|nr:hypothetical protein [Phenylobacterium sp.]